MAKRIHILATGGTIAGKADTRGGYTAGQVTVETLLNALPARPQGLVVTYEQIANVGSQSITDKIWRELANRINKISNESLADGIVVTHGTDTMEETAYFLNLVTSGRIPVVITGAMKPADAFSPDGPENLLSAIYLAGQTNVAKLGVLVVMNSAIHSARYVQKVGSNQDSAFKSTPVGIVGTQRGQKSAFFVNELTKRHTTRTIFTEAIQTGALNLQGDTGLPDVSILYVHAGMPEEMLNHWMAMPQQGIVVAGVGSGNINSFLELMLARQAAKGTLIVRSSRLAFAQVERNVEVNDDKLGFVAAGNLNPSKARILLQLALKLKLPFTQVQELFDTH